METCTFRKFHYLCSTWSLHFYYAANNHISQRKAMVPFKWPLIELEGLIEFKNPSFNIWRKKQKNKEKQRKKEKQRNC